MQLNPINHASKPPQPNLNNMSAASGPLSSLNFAEKANRPTLDPITHSSKKMGRGISSTSRSGFTNEAAE